MHEYDVALKLTLQQVDVAIRELTGAAIARWHNVELPEVQNTRVDLLGETASGELIHIELQASNDRTIPLRMAEYYLRVFRQFARFPQQVLLYVGNAPMSMEAELNTPALKHSYRIIDIRDLDGALLLESSHLADNIVAVLTRLPDARAAVHRIVARIAELPPGERETAAEQLFILAGLRKLGRIVTEEVERTMPILTSILEHDVIGPEYNRGVHEGVQQGKLQGELKMLHRLIEKRFGQLPDWAAAKLAGRTTTELEDLSVRVLDAPSLEDLLQ